MRITTNHQIWVVAVLLAAATLLHTPADAAVAGDILSLTSNQRTRIVWDRVPSGADAWNQNTGHELKGFDTDQGSEVTILSGGTYGKPLLTHEGRRVVYSSRNDQSCWIVNWDGSGHRKVCGGYAGDVWRDPNSGTEWVYVRPTFMTTGGGIVRYQIDNPSVKERIITGDVGLGTDNWIHPTVWLQVSADGTKAAGANPWSNCGMFDLTNGTFTAYQSGCWTSMCPDNSYRMWVFHNPHVEVGMYDANKSNYRVVNLGDGYYPKWTNHPRYLMYSRNGIGKTSSELYMGRFSSNFNSVEQWVRVTSNGVPDDWCDAYVGVDAAPPVPSLDLSPTGLAFEAEEGAGNPAVQTVSAGTPFGELENLRATDNTTWLTVSVSGSGAQYTLSNTVNISSLSAGIHQATVTVAADNSEPRTRTYSVTCTVRGAPVASSLSLSPAAGVVTVGGTLTFAAAVLDQFGDPMSPQPTVAWSVSALAGTSISGGVLTAGQTLGTATVTAAAAGFTETAQVEVVAYVPFSLKVNTGDNSPAVAGWESDASYLVSGQTGATWEWNAETSVSGVADAAPADVYRTARRADHAYSFANVPNGSYTVRIHFTDGYATGRRMDYTIEGVKVIDGLNVADETGGTYQALVKSFDVTVSDGNGMQILAEKDDGNDVFESGIEIQSAGAAPQDPITLLAPTGAGLSYTVGDTLLVQWTSPDTLPVDIRISPDEGETWFLIIPETIQRDDPSYGTYAWVVTETVTDAGGSASAVSDHVLIKVNDYFAPDVFDMTTEVISITRDGATVARSDALQRSRPVYACRDGILTIDLRGCGPHQAHLFGLDGRLVWQSSGRDGRLYQIRLDRGTRAGVLRLHTAQGVSTYEVISPR